MRSPLLSLGAKARLLAEALRGPREGARSETLERFVTRRFGSGIAERFLVPFTRGIYGADPSRLGAGDAFPTLVALERRRGSVLRALLSRRGGVPRQALRVEGGMGRLPEAIAAALGKRAWAGARVEALAPPPAAPGAPLELTLGAGDRVLAREVVLAVPPPRQAALIRPFAPHLADAVGAVRATPIAVVALGLPPGNPALPPGFGFLCARESGARILGATFASHLAPEVAPAGHALATVFLGGSEDRDALVLSDAALARVAVDDLSRALGGRVAPDLADVHRMPQALPLFSPGHRGRMALLQAALSRWGVRLSGSHVTGVALDACVAPPTGS
jgi:oxygen-dependent protoporphyrinogen oxidase